MQRAGLEAPTRAVRAFTSSSSRAASIPPCPLTRPHKRRPVVFIPGGAVLAARHRRRRLRLPPRRLGRCHRSGGRGRGRSVRRRMRRRESLGGRGAGARAGGVGAEVALDQEIVQVPGVVGVWARGGVGAATTMMTQVSRGGGGRVGAGSGRDEGPRQVRAAGGGGGPRPRLGSPINSPSIGLAPPALPLHPLSPPPATGAAGRGSPATVDAGRLSLRGVFPKIGRLGELLSQRP
jgi:hypothetical protein